MIEKETVLILGAGASTDYGYPLGRTLIMSICKELDDESNHFSELLEQCEFRQELRRDFREGLKQSNLPSIDAFLENRPD